MVVPIKLAHPGGGNWQFDKTRISVSAAATDAFIDVQVDEVRTDAVYGLFVFSPSLMTAPAEYQPSEGDTPADIAAALVAAYNADPVADVTATDNLDGTYRLTIGIVAELSFSLFARKPSGFEQHADQKPFQSILNNVYVIRTGAYLQASTATGATTAATIIDKFIGPGGPIIGPGGAVFNSADFQTVSASLFEVRPFGGSEEPLVVTVNHMTITASAFIEGSTTAYHLIGREVSRRKRFFLQNQHGSQAATVKFGEAAAAGDFSLAAGAYRDWTSPPPVGPLNVNGSAAFALYAEVE